ncbi:hypothetical protein CASFOL_034224 [Castilleja foliolosa]|uniref:COP1-interacting protein 7 n=1 Tax=Castilleja foliolosa TaxID=1961234 RepID=A0ABD3BX08_9LAMI
MDTAIGASSVLDYIEFQFVPSQNRYEACVCYENKKEKVSSGLLEHLLLHSNETKALHSQGSDAKFKLCAPENTHDIKWFTKSTLIRFLHIIGSADILDVTNSLKNEISQLEETRKFHLSLYAKDSQYPPQSSQSDDSCSEDTSSTTKAEGSNASKNELLRAMDVRLSALRGELTTAFDQSAGSRYSMEEMTDIHKFSQHFGSKDFSDSLRTYIEIRQSEKNTSSRNKSLSSGTQVKYEASPAKAAQIERQSSTESGRSSFSSEEERPSVDRSRTLIRAASPRRSASPMRRVQIGRSGSRRSTAITIKSMNYFPAREKSFFPRDENDSDEEGPKKSENSVRMSVKDRINLFESKQRDEIGDSHKAKSVLNSNKSEMRRWSSGMGEDTSAEDTTVEDTEVQHNVENREIIETCEKDVKSESLENEPCSPALISQEEPHPTESTDVIEKSNASAEWSRQKEAELNELFMKMMETKPIKGRAIAPAISKRQSLPNEQRGDVYNNYKEKRDEKLKVDASKKKLEKQKPSRGMQQVNDVNKSKPTPVNRSDDSKKHTVKKIQKPQTANPKTEKPRHISVKKDSPKPSLLPTTRKSWPSIPSAKVTGLSPATTPPATSFTNNATPTRRRSQPTTPPVSNSSSKVGTPQTRAKPVKSHPSDIKKSPKSDPEKKLQPSTKPTLSTKLKVVQNGPKDLASSTKSNLHSKATKKSSVVPIESKPSLRKVSKTMSGVNPTFTRKTSHPQDPLRKSKDRDPPQENVTTFVSADPVIHQEEKETEVLENHSVMEPGPTPRTPEKCESNGFSQISPVTDDNGIDLLILPELEPEAEEELTISPRAWVEIEENEDRSITSVDHSVGLPTSDIHIAPVEVSSPRVRHSLSQMLLQESSEPDFFEWGNAENPPPMVYQKDVPKGLKRLLKFARKSKNEANTTDWSSPPVFSEGEDDADDLKLVSKRSGENLLRKSTLHSMNDGHQKSGTSDFEHPAQANVSKHSAQSLSQQFQPGHVSASVTTTKATRSFFSLSAFKGGK